MLTKDIKVPDVATPTPDGILDTIVEWTLSHSMFVGVVVVAMLVMVAVRATGGAVAGIAGKLTIPIGIAVMAMVAIGATMLFK